MLKPTVVLNKYSMHMVELRNAGDEAAKKWCVMAHGMLCYMCVIGTCVLWHMCVMLKRLAVYLGDGRSPSHEIEKVLE